MVTSHKTVTLHTPVFPPRPQSSDIAWMTVAPRRRCDHLRAATAACHRCHCRCCVNCHKADYCMSSLINQELPCSLAQLAHTSDSSRQRIAKKS